ncbi:MAG: ferrous iron transport protein A [Clostridia bacterium]|nr:ferrous iron transport protein A [Clostridia bacterium]MBQ7224084.1 ferrous iron transport protein A [Clostridia bacterium]MBR7140783.1 ferrous iron transport protein A [Clostridia bacterium]
MTLMDARVDKVYKVVATNGEKNEKRRLLDMGFTPECKIYVAHTAPFGGTILVGLRGFLVALREDAASLIEITEVK